MEREPGFSALHLPVCFWFFGKADIPDGQPWQEKLNSISTYWSRKKLMEAVDTLEFLKSFDVWVSISVSCRRLVYVCVYYGKMYIT